MAVTYEPIATTTLGSAAANITFNSIPSTYTDLRLVLVGTTATNSTNLYIQFNSDTASNYSVTTLYGTGAAAGSSRLTSQTVISLNVDGAASSTIPHLYTADIFAYAGSTFKTCLLTANEDKNGSGYVETTVGLWRSTTAINAIKVYASAGNLNTGFVATLYGILKA